MGLSADEARIPKGETEEIPTSSPPCFTAKEAEGGHRHKQSSTWTTGCSGATSAPKWLCTWSEVSGSPP
jgi:hypothetical protein